MPTSTDQPLIKQMRARLADEAAHLSLTLDTRQLDELAYAATSCAMSNDPRCAPKPDPGTDAGPQVAPRRVYLDCEFVPAIATNRGLVSIGLTDNQGRDYYAVNAEMDYAAVQAHPFLREHVWPMLPRTPALGLDRAHRDVKPLSQIRHDIAAYFAPSFGAGTARDRAATLIAHPALLAEPVDGKDEAAQAARAELYAYYGAADLARLHGLWDNNWSDMPRAIPRWYYDLKALAAQAGNPDLPAKNADQHHPLGDAHWNRDTHEHLLRLTARDVDEESAQVLLKNGLDTLRRWRDNHPDILNPQAAQLLYEVGAALTDQDV